MDDDEDAYRATGKNAGIVAISGKRRAHAGMGVLVGPRHVVTCAHVVNAALGRKEGERKQPTKVQRVSVDFPMASEKSPIDGRVVNWRPVGQRRGDIAVVQLSRDAPEECGLAILADVPAGAMEGNALSVFGIAGGAGFGLHIAARFTGSASADRMQIGGADALGAFVLPGYSGAAVWDERHAVTIGMSVARLVPEKEERIAFMIPARDLKALRPDLPVERRRLSRGYDFAWTLYASFVFLLMLVHFGAEKKIDLFQLLSLSGEHQALAAFWGMHAGAFFLPPLIWMAIKYALAFHQHPPASRFPRFGFNRDYPRGDGSKLRLWLGLALLIALPLAAQVYFIERFHQNGYVYIYPDKFGYSTEELRSRPDWTCAAGSDALCTQQKLSDRYTMMVGKYIFNTSYLDNAYHYGEKPIVAKNESFRETEIGNSGGTVTFYPLFQPLFIIAMTVVDFALAIWLGTLVFSAPRKIGGKPEPEPEGRAAELEQRQAVASKPGSATEAITPSI